MGIKTIGDLAHSNPEILHSHLKNRGSYFIIMQMELMNHPWKKKGRNPKDMGTA
jgi:hypothetical protein